MTVRRFPQRKFCLFCLKPIADGSSFKTLTQCVEDGKTPHGIQVVTVGVTLYHHKVCPNER